MMQQSVAPIQTRDRLLESAFSEFSEQGYYKTNVDTITRRAGVSHGTFYLYFKNKNELLKLVIQDLMQKIPGIVYRVTSPVNIQDMILTPELLPEFEQAIRIFVETLANASGLIKAFMQGMLQDRELFSFSIHLVRELASIFKMFVKTAQKQGRFRGCDATIIAEIMSICLSTSILMRATDIIAGNPETLARNIAGILYPALLFDQDRRFPARAKEETSAKKKKTSKALIEAAKHELAIHGYFDTKIAAIAKKAGLSRGTFYLYFKDKDEIIEAVFADMLSTLNPFRSGADDFFQGLDMSSIDDLIKINTVIIEVFDTPFNRALLQGTFCSEKLSANYKRFIDIYSTPIIAKISMLQKVGKCQDVDPAIAAQIIQTTVSYTAFLRNLGIIMCTKREFAVNMAWFLYYFLNYPSGSALLR